MRKIIHYCWFGKGEKSDLIKKCMKSWKKYCPDYEVIEWNEENFDVESNQFTKEAYEKKKWAFVSDYVRLYALEKFGGIYLDTDVEIKKNLDAFLEYDFFTGKESEDLIVTSLMGAKKGEEIISEFLKYYQKRKFIIDGKMDKTPNTKILSKILKDKYKLKITNEKIIISEKKIIFNESYFCSKSNEEINYAIHHFEGSWISKSELKNNLLLYQNQYNILSEILETGYNEEKISLIKERLKDKKICIYGFGSIGKAVVQFFNTNNINNYKIYDENLKDSSCTEYLMTEEDIKKEEIDIILVTPWQYWNEIIYKLNEKKCINICEIFNIKIIRC